MAARGALKRAGKCLGYDPQYIIQLSKTIPKFSDNEEEFQGIEAEWHLLDQINTPELNELITLAKSFVGILQNYGVHASGVIVFPDDPNNYCAIEKSGDNFVTAYEFKTLENLGILKLDILGVKMTDVIYDTLKLANVDLDLAHLPMDDKKTFDMLCQGNTAGVFQIEGNGFTQLVKRVQPRHFEDLAPLMAVFRPGIIAAGLLETYIKRRNGEENIEYLHPILEPILKPTYGIIVYQEQIIEIAKVVCGYSLGEADLLRRAVGKKLPEEMAKIKPDFISRAIQNGYTEEIATKLFDLIEFFANYGFNKCLAGSEYIYRNQNGKWQPTIAEMYKIKNNKEYAKQTNHYNLYKKYQKNGYGKALSMCQDGRLRENDIKDISYSGIQRIYKVTTKSGCTVKCTMNHKFPTPMGNKMLCELNIGDSIYVLESYDTQSSTYNFYNSKKYENNFPKPGQCGFQSKPNGASVIYSTLREFYNNIVAPCEKCGKHPINIRFELHHIDGNRENNTPDNLMWLCNSCYKKEQYKLGRTKKYGKGLLTNTDEITSIEYIGEEETYNIEMNAPNHNLLMSGGIIVSNSHAFGYGWLSYVSAYLKANYTKEYMVSLINSEEKQEDAIKYIDECKKLNISILPPDLSKRNTQWVIEGNSLRVGLHYIKGIGKNLDLSNINTFESIITNNSKNVIEALIKSGALDYLNLSRSYMLSSLQSIQDILHRKQQCIEKIKEYQQKLSESTIPKDINKYQRQLNSWKQKLAEAETREIINTSDSYDEAAGEIEVLGFSFKQIPRIKQGIITHIYTKNDKKEREMAWITFNTPYGEIKGTCFANGWKLIKNKVKQGGNCKFIVNDQGILEEINVDGQTYKTNERRFVK